MRHLFGGIARALEIALLLLVVCWPASAAAGHQGTTGSEAADAAGALEKARAALAEKPPHIVEARVALSQARESGAGKEVAAEASFRLGVLDEGELEFPLALADYGRTSAEAPSTVWARNARKRVAWLREHAEGDFVPLAQFEKVTRTTGPVGPEIDALARDADGFPDGRTRSEARMLVAQTWLKTPGRSDDAADELKKVLADPFAEVRTKVFAERDLVGVWLAKGGIDQAAEVLWAYPLDPQLVAKVQELSRKRRLRRSVIAMSALLGLATACLVSRRRRWNEHPDVG